MPREKSLTTNGWRKLRGLIIYHETKFYETFSVNFLAMILLAIILSHLKQNTKVSPCSTFDNFKFLIPSMGHCGNYN